MKIPFILLLFTVSTYCLQAQATAKQSHGPNAKGSYKERTKKTSKSEFSVHLIPGTTRVSISCKNVPENAPITVRISNPAGKLVYATSTHTKKKVYETSIGIKSKPIGVYVAEIIVGDQRKVERIIVQ